MKKSYNQKAAAYWAIIKANPKTSANEIGRRYKGKPLGMKKQDRNDLVRSLKDAHEFNQRTKNSDMREYTKNRLAKSIYQSAKHTTRKGLKDNPPKKGVSTRTVRETINHTFGQYQEEDDFTEFYGVDE